MNRKKLIPIIVIVIVLVLVIALVAIFMLPGGKTTAGARKAIILSSANDYYRKDGEPDFNDGIDGSFSSEPFPPKWIGNFTNGTVGIDGNLPGHDNPGAVYLAANWVPWQSHSVHVNLEFVYNWTNYYPLYKGAAYNLSAWVNITTYGGGPANISLPGTGARIGLRWLDSGNHKVKTDWSKGIFNTSGAWVFLNVTGVADDPIKEITQLHLVLAVEGNMTYPDMVLFDDVRVEYWFPPPIPSPPPSNKDTDGFPAQALQVYWILKNHGYTDDNIFLMLYHKNDTVIDIYANDSIFNHLTGAIIDVENDYVTASRFKQELDVSIPGSFASGINPKDQLIIFMTDHGSNKVLAGGHATFHFEADDSYITETEFFNLVSQINCERMMINIDICFSGNFLCPDVNIGVSWYNIPNSILITSSANTLTWCWRNINNADGFAGSWFFHQFWDQLNQSETIGTAFDFAKDFIPAGQVKTIYDIQEPLIRDNLGIKDSWGFNGNYQL